MTGKIISFYSFKGGVGRTMALANVAFITALNGKRVLVVDWDLEAPGLGYYFRGLVNSRAAKEMKQAEGILNIVWNWSTLMERAETPDDVTSLVAGLDDVSFFSGLTTNLADDIMAELGCALDYIGAGNERIGVGTDAVSYEAALSEFSWTDFFNKAAGGRLIEAFRRWAVANYDYIFVDSRTGFADDAGVCTVQIPDVVALCFVLNRQNIDGVAKIAGVIRKTRENEVKLRSVTMRMTQTGTGEESDALARARRQLTRTGKIETEIVDFDLRRLLIRTQAVPYYETLAILSASVAQRDTLSLDFLNLAAELCGEEFIIPELDEEFLQLARERLQPTHATSDYLESLRAAEPERAIYEMLRLLDNARAMEIDGEDLDDDYVGTLVATASYISEKLADEIEANEILERSADLLRDLYRQTPSKWRMPLADNLERLARAASVLDLQDEEELAALDELETVLATGISSPSSLIRRLSAKRRIARLFIRNRAGEEADRTLAEINTLLAQLKKSAVRSTEERNEELLVEMDYLMLRGDMSRLIGPDDPPEAKNRNPVRDYIKAFEIGSRAAPFIGRSELQRSMFELATRVSGTSTDVEVAAKFAMDAARLHFSPASIAPHFVRLAGAVSRASNAGTMIPEFVALTMGREGRLTTTTLASYLGRGPASLLAFLNIANEMAELSSRRNHTDNAAILLLSSTILTSITSLRRRQGPNRLLNSNGLRDALLRWRELASPNLPVLDIDQLNESINWLTTAKRGA